MGRWKPQPWTSFLQHSSPFVWDVRIDCQLIHVEQRAVPSQRFRQADGIFPGTHSAGRPSATHKYSNNGHPRHAVATVRAACCIYRSYKSRWRIRVQCAPSASTPSSTGSTWPATCACMCEIADAHSFAT
jgi:hypothetical protein